METQIVKTTVYEVYNEFGTLCGRYSQRKDAVNDIFWAKRGLSPLALCDYHIEEKEQEETYDVEHRKFRKNSRFHGFRGHVVKFLTKNNRDYYYEWDGKLYPCFYNYR